jgi:predicted MFS family arabinose efflux permease
LLGPLGGVPIDRLGPRRAILVADTCATVVSIALAFTTSYAQLVVLSALFGATRSVSEPALSALAPRLVDDEQLLRANSLLGASSMSSIAFGPLLAAAAIALWGPRGAFFADAVTYMIGNAVVLPLVLRPIARADSAERVTIVSELRDGLRVVRESTSVRRILGCCSSVYLVWGAYAVIEPLYVRDVLHRPASTFALLQAAFGSMLLLNAFIVPRGGDRVASMRTLRVVALVTAGVAPVYVGTTWVAVAFAGVATWGAATAWIVAPRDTLLQRATPVQMHGRVLAFDNALRSLAHVVALPLAALLVTGAGVRGAAFTFALMPVLGVLATRDHSSASGDAQARRMLHA